MVTVFRCTLNTTAISVFAYGVNIRYFSATERNSDELHYTKIILGMFPLRKFLQKYGVLWRLYSLKLLQFVTFY